MNLASESERQSWYGSALSLVKLWSPAGTDSFSWQKKKVVLCWNMVLDMFLYAPTVLLNLLSWVSFSGMLWPEFCLWLVFIDLTVIDIKYCEKVLNSPYFCIFCFHICFIEAVWKSSWPKTEQKATKLQRFLDYPIRSLEQYWWRLAK